MGILEIRIADGLKLAVPASLTCITTYVLLEQESWFEKEGAFVSRWLRPGMTAIDIGANIGYYAIIMAHRVGPGGRVFAYEPAGEPRALLEHNRALNNLSQLEIVAVALSDGVRQGRMVIGESSELNALGTGERGEDVSVTTLDLEEARHGWVKPDFIKMDVEGEEARIVAGGQHFFTAYSPLVMFETKVGTTFNEPLRAAFRAMGYRLYRQLDGAPILVRAESDALDGFELNAFAAKPNRAAALEAEGLLVDPIADWAPDEAALKRGWPRFASRNLPPRWEASWATTPPSMQTIAPRSRVTQPGASRICRPANAARRWLSPCAHCVTYACARRPRSACRHSHVSRPIGERARKA